MFVGHRGRGSTNVCGGVSSLGFATLNVEQVIMYKIDDVGNYYTLVNILIAQQSIYLLLKFMQNKFDV